MMKQKKVPKFSSINKINLVICQDNPPILKTLTLIEKILIAWYYLVMSILKLRSNWASLLVAYQYVCGCIIVIS